MNSPVAIIGGGLAGLTCARQLQSAGIPYVLFEASDRLGGKLKTDYVDGYTLDHGFQVHFTAYPNAQKVIDSESLDGKAFGKGSLLFLGESLEIIAKDKPFHTAISPALSIVDKIKTLFLTHAISTRPENDLKTLDMFNHKSAEEALRDLGFSENYLDRFARPFFGGVFLDRSLRICESQFTWVWKMLGAGDTILPKRGMAALPDALTEGLSNLNVDSPVSEIRKSQSGFKIKVGDEYTVASAVVLACNASAVEGLSGIEVDKETNHSICLYFRVPIAPVDKPYLILNATGAGLVNHVAPLTLIQPSYAPLGKHLVSVTILGESSTSDEELAIIAKQELQMWFPDRKVDEWEFVRAYRIKDAQLVQKPGFRKRNPDPTTIVPGMFLAGEYTTSSSIDGAIESGMIAANLVSEYVKEN